MSAFPVIKFVPIIPRYEIVELCVRFLRLELLHRAEIVSEREGLFKDLLMLPHFRERLYEMSFQDRSFYTSDFDSCSLSVGDNEQFFQVFNDHLSIASLVLNKNVLELDRVVKKAEKNSKKNGTLREVLANLMSKTGTRVSVDEQVQFLEGFLELSESSSERECAFNVAVVSAVVLLYVVYQYLMGCLNRKGAKSYSSGSLDFRDIYVSIVLFQGAYVWIKFRQAARSGCLKRKSCETQDVQVRDGSDLEGVYVRAMKDKSGTVTRYKYEPRFKPPREKLDSGTTQKFNCLSLGQYNTPGEAKIVRQIAAFYYGKDEGWVVLEDGSSFSIPPMSEPEECFSGVEKAKWVTWKAKKVFEDLRKEKVKSKQLRRATRTGSHFGRHGSDTESELSPFAATCSFPTPSRSADEHSDFPLVALVEPAASPGGSGAEQLVDSVPGDTTSEPIPAVEHFSDVNCFGVKDNDIAPESDDHGKISGHVGDCSETDSGIEYMIAELILGCALVSPQRDDQIHHSGVSKILGDYSPPEVDGATRGFELVEPELSPNLNSQQGWDLVGAVSEKTGTWFSVDAHLQKHKYLFEGFLELSERECALNVEHSEVPLDALVEPAPSHGGSGAEQLADSVPGNTTSEPIPAVEHFSDVNCSGVDYNVPAKDNDIAPESDDHGKILGHAGDYSETDEDKIAELIFGCAHVSPQRDDQMHHLGVSKIPGDYSLPEVSGFELVEPELSPNLNSQQGWDVIGAVSENIVASGSSFFFKERDPVLGQVNHLQQLLSRQKKLLEDSAIRYVDLQHQLSEAEVKNSELQREKSELQEENERLRAMLQQVAKPQVATWSGLIIDFQHEEGR